MYHLWIQACGPYTPEETLQLARNLLGERAVLAAKPVSEALQAHMVTARIEVADACDVRAAAKTLWDDELTAYASEPVVCPCGGNDNDRCFACGTSGLASRPVVETPDPAKIDRKYSHRLFLRAKVGERVRALNADAVADIWAWCGERARSNNDLATPRWHPTVPGMVEIEIVGCLSEETFHVWDQHFDVWAEDTLRGKPWLRRARSAPKLCKACGGRGVTPSPINFP